MKITTHVLFGIFLALAVFNATGNDTLAAAAFFFHVFPLIDLLLMQGCKGEPFHTVYGGLIIVLALYLIEPILLNVAMLGYLTHLALDVLMPEGIQFWWPFYDSKQKLVLKGAERAVWWVSVIGIVQAILID